MIKLDNIVHYNMLDALVRLDVHDNHYDLYASCIFMNILLKRPNHEYSLNYKDKQKLYSKYGYENANKYLFNELFEIIKDYSTENNTSRVHKIKQKYSIFLVEAMYYTLDSRVKLTLKKNSIDVISYDGEIYDTIYKAHKKTGDSKYMINKNAIRKKILTLLMEEIEPQASYAWGHYERKIKYNKDGVIAFYRRSLKDSTIAGRLLQLGERGVYTLAEIGKGEMKDGITYNDSPSGRLFAITEDFGNLQMSESVYRELFFDGQYEIDINTANASIMYQFYKKHRGWKLETIEDYIKNKEKYRNIIVRKYGVSYNTAKRVINSLFFGARIFNYPKSLKKLVGKKVLNTIAHDEELYPFFREIDRMQYKIYNYIRFNSVDLSNDKIKVKNLAGKTQVFNVNDKNKIISHIYFGIERRALNIMDKTTNANLLLHDAVVCEELPDLKKLSKKIEKDTGYKLTFSYTQYSSERFYKRLEEVERLRR